MMRKRQWRQIIENNDDDNRNELYCDSRTRAANELKHKTNEQQQIYYILKQHTKKNETQQENKKKITHSMLTLVRCV